LPPRVRRVPNWQRSSSTHQLDVLVGGHVSVVGRVLVVKIEIYDVWPSKNNWPTVQA
jgi:hypothetical protein